MTARDQGSEQLWIELEAINCQRLTERLAQIIAIDPDDRLGLVTETVSIRRIQN